ncbi:MAG: type II toxin-antitoxin system HipA family toxin [Burkholderiaceae bacterium]
MTSERDAFIYIQLPGSLETVAAARLVIETPASGINVGRFAYGRSYLERADAIEFDPFSLPLKSGVTEFTKLRGVPGAVRDASPDAWGRRVIEHHLRAGPRDLSEIDYLLNGPQDGAGSLSFGRGPQPPAPRGRFNQTQQLDSLIEAADAVEDGRLIPAQLLAGFSESGLGTSLGGARPKATIEDDDRLWLAKFPERGDEINLQRIEGATLELAKRAGLSVCNARLQKVGALDVLMLERFDRRRVDGDYLRFGFVSGLTVLDADDTYLDRSQWSYLLLADELRRWSSRPQRDLAELFRRVVFNAAVTNIDDHPRNHALVRHADGWRLSPAYDLVPQRSLSQERRDLAMTVGRFGRAASLFNILSECGRFGLALDQARAEFERIVKIVEAWRNVFHELGVSERDIEYVAPAFTPPSLFLEQPVEPPL